MPMSMFQWVYPSRYLSWEATDNCKGTTYPLKIYRYIPSEVVDIEKAILQFSIENFRAYTTTTPSGGGATSGVNDEFTLVEAGDDSASAVSVGSAAFVAVATISPSVDCSTCFIEVVPDRDDYSWIRLYLYVSDGTTDYPNSSGTPHMVYGSYIGGDPSPARTFLLPDNVNGKTLTVYAKRDVGDPTDVSFSVIWTTFGEHIHSTPNHVHGMAYDIYESVPVSPSISIKINGSDRTAALGGPWATNQNNLSIAQYLNIGEWNTIELIGVSEGDVIVLNEDCSAGHIAANWSGDTANFDDSGNFFNHPVAGWKAIYKDVSLGTVTAFEFSAKFRVSYGNGANNTNRTDFFADSSSSPGSYYRILVNKGVNIRVDSGGSSTILESDITPADDTWYTVKVTRDAAGLMKLYVDDVEKDSTTDTTHTTGDYVRLEADSAGAGWDDIKFSGGGVMRLNASCLVTVVV